MQSIDDCGPDSRFAEFLGEGRFMIQRCRSTGRHFFYPRVAEPDTGDTDVEWVEASGRGTVYSTTVVRKRPDGDSYNVALIDLAEGPRVMSRVVDLDPRAVRIDMAVEAFIGRLDERPLVLFRAAGDKF
jgi:hypothetical protein